MLKAIFASIYGTSKSDGGTCFTCDGSCHCECDGSGDPCNWG